MRVAEHRLAAMGGEGHIVVVGGGPALIDLAAQALAELELRWSRFLPDSDISRLNGAAGRAVAVAPETYELVERAVAAWWATDGRFDPTVLPALVAAGYDRTFERLDGAVVTPAVPAPGCGGIRLDPDGPAVALPGGVAFDAGGIGKGLAADLVVGRLLDAGAAGACVNIGGDLRVAGRPPSGQAWSIGIEHPDDPTRQLIQLAVAGGGVATSSGRVRRWRAGGLDRHHLIDPRTGDCAAAGVAAVTVVTGEAWWAEVLAKAVFVGGPERGRALLTRLGACGLVVLEGGGVVELPGLERFVA